LPYYYSISFLWIRRPPRPPLFPYTTLFRSANAALLAGFVSFMKEAKAKDKKTVEFHLKEPFSLFPERISVVKIVNGSLRWNSTRSEEHTSELQSRFDLVCRLLLEKKKIKNT